MNALGIGINADSSRIDGRLEVLREDLDCFIKVGFDYVELPIHGLDLLINGRLNKEQLKLVKSIIKDYPFKYTVHSPDKLNLMSCYEGETHKDCLEATIDFAGEIGAGIVVYHSSHATFTSKMLREYYYQRYGMAGLIPLFHRLCEEDAVNLYKAGEYAKTRGVVIAVENLWLEHLEDIYTYGAYAEDLFRHIKQVGHPNVGITYDFGHGYINSKTYGFDYMEAIKMVLPYLKHVHIHDNFGKPDRGEKYIDRLPFGYGDLHMPPGFGEIPYTEIIKLLEGYSGVFTMEIAPRYKPYFAQALADAQKLIKL